MESFQFTITLAIVIITCVVSINAFSNEKLKRDLIYFPPDVTYRKQWYRFFTCGLIHADWPHLIFNMITLYYFGRNVEQAFQFIVFGPSGKYMYLVMYVLALFFCLLPTHLKNKDNYHYASLGASGAVSAVMFAAFLLAPGIGVRFFFIPIDIPGFIFAPLYIVISTLLEKQGGSGINHSAHIFGGLFGLAFVIIAGKLAVDFDAVTWCIDGIKQYFAQI